MLVKLFKYEFKAISSKLLPIYGALGIITLIYRLTMPLKVLLSASEFMRVVINLIKEISLFLQWAGLIGVFGVTFYVIVERFYKNIYSDEGYLTLTLPIRPWKHLFVKLTTAVAWTLLSVAIGTICLNITIYKDKIQGIAQMQNIIITMNRYINIDIQPIVSGISLLILLAIIEIILQLYLSVSIGQLFSTKHKLLASFAAFLIINTLVQILAVIGLFIVGYVSPDQWLQSYSYSNGLNILLVYTIGGAIILIILFWTAIDYIMNYKVNLE